MIASTINLYKSAYSGLSRKIWLLSIVMLINRMGTMVLAFMTLYCYHLGYTIQQGGLVVAIYGIGSVIGSLLGGRISDKLGFYYTQFSALFFGGLLFILLGQMHAYLSICIVTFFLSTVNESFRPANAAAIAHYSNKVNRTQSYALVRLAVNIGFGAGIAIGGFLASVDYKLLFWADGITSIVASILLLIILPKVSLGQQHHVVNSNGNASVDRSPYKDRKFLYFLFFQVLFSICFFQLFTTVPIFFKENLHLSESMYGLVMAMNGIIIALFEMVLVFKLEGRSAYLVFMRYGAILMGLSFLTMNLPLANGVIIAFVAILMLTLAEMISMPFMNSYYIARSSEQSRGQYAGLYTMSWSLAQVIGSTSGTAIADKFGFFNLWIIICSLCFITAGGYYWLQRKS